MTLNFYSTKAYNYVRKTFNLALPHVSTIRKWSTVVKCDPGYSEIAFQTLAEKVHAARSVSKTVYCSLMLDEMSIKKQIDFDGHHNWGYVDVGVEIDDDEVTPATHALVLMVVALNASWKLPIAYFLITELTGVEKANIIEEALIRLDDIGIEITSVTCDGPSAHFSMFRALGCVISDPSSADFKPYFIHPNNQNKKVYAILDICHMLKLIRNGLASLKVILDPDGNEVNWNFIEKLHAVQQNETLILANKLSKKHINWQRQKMKVCN